MIRLKLEDFLLNNKLSIYTKEDAFHIFSIRNAKYIYIDIKSILNVRGIKCYCAYTAYKSKKEYFYISAEIINSNFCIDNYIYKQFLETE